MSRLSQPPSIECVDGTLFFVEDRDDVLVATVAYPDPALTASGLLAHVRIPIDGPIVELVSPPVQHVRDFVRRHGGVAVAEDRAVHVLKAMAGREGPPPAPFSVWPRRTRHMPAPMSASGNAS